VRNEQHGVAAFAVISGNLLQQVVASHRVKSGGRFVQNQHLRIHRDHAGNGSPPFFAAGKIKRRFFQQRLGQPGKVGGLLHPAADFFFGKSHVFWTEGDIFCHGFLEQLVLGVLKHHADLKPHGADFLRLFPDVVPVEQHLAGAWAEQTVEMLHQRGFARTGVADDTQKFAFPHGDGNVGDRVMRKRRSLTVGIGEIFCFENIHAILIPFASEDQTAAR